jgi:hypothetical protein
LAPIRNSLRSFPVGSGCFIEVGNNLHRAAHIVASGLQFSPWKSSDINQRIAFTDPRNIAKNTRKGVYQPQPLAEDLVNRTVKVAGGRIEDSSKERGDFAVRNSHALTSFVVAGSAVVQTYAAQSRPNLTAAQESSVRNTLGIEQAQPAPDGYQPEVGGKIPTSLQTREVPFELTQQIPQLQTFHYALMPGYIVVVDPKTDTVWELIETPPP